MFKVLFNLGSIITLIKCLKKMIEEMIASANHMPTEKSVVLVVGQVTKLLSSGVIDIPGVDENVLAQKIEEVQKAILQKVGE